MQRSRLLMILLTVLVVGCAVEGESSNFRPSNGLGAAWTAWVVGLLGVLFPDLGSRLSGFDDRSITKIAAGALLLVGSVGLADYYLDLDIVRPVQSNAEIGT
jgi:hypothetical protein